MRLSTRARQAVVALIDVAQHQSVGPVTLAEISRRRDISVSYLELMFSQLRRAGLVESTRGPGGGYTIEPRLASITVADIFKAVDQAQLEADLPQPGATHEAGAGRCLTPELWSALNQHVIDYLDSVNLQSLVNAQPAVDPQILRTSTRKQPLPRRLEGSVQRVAPKPPKVPNSVFELGRFQAT